jgi:hypothetical protein
MNQQNIDVVIKAQDSENKTICVLVWKWASHVLIVIDLFTASRTIYQYTVILLLLKYNSVQGPWFKIPKGLRYINMLKKKSQKEVEAHLGLGTFTWAWEANV